MLSWPAFYNGYPLLWFDSTGYLAVVWGHAYGAALRSPFYSLSLAPLLALQSEWPVVLAQATISAAMIFLLLRTMAGRVAPSRYLLLIGLLALLTSLPWTASIVLADVYAGLLPLGIFLLAFASERLAAWEIVFVFVVTCLGALVHYSHLPLAAALAGTALILLLLERRPLGVALRRAALGLAVVLIAIVGHVGLQWTLNGKVALAPNGSMFLLARLVEDGPAKAYLVAHCPERHFALCAFLDDMPMSAVQFLFRDQGPRHRMETTILRNEADIVVAGTLREQPLQVAWSAARNTLRQLAMFRTETNIVDYRATHPEAQNDVAMMKANLPGEYESFLQSRQSNGNIGLKDVFWLHVMTVRVSAVLLCLLLPWIVACGERRLREFTWLALAAVAANAAVCGALSAQVDRYGSRVVWLLPMLLCLAAFSVFDSGAGRLASRPAR
jgi:hypothetical protein